MSKKTNIVITKSRKNLCMTYKNMSHVHSMGFYDILDYYVLCTSVFAFVMSHHCHILVSFIWEWSFKIETIFQHPGTDAKL